jgi:hypothetical protein
LYFGTYLEHFGNVKQPYTTHYKGKGILLMHGLEQSIVNIRNNTIMVIKLYLRDKSVDDIAAEVKLSKTEVLEIIEKFNSN